VLTNIQSHYLRRVLNLAKHLIEKDINNVVRLLTHWEGKLTWKKLVDKFHYECGIQTTRQTLADHEKIKTAYDAIKKHDPKTVPKSPTLAMAQKTIEKQNILIGVYEKNIARYEEQFSRWLYNAKKSNVTIERLNKAVPGKPIDTTEE